MATSPNRSYELLVESLRLIAAKAAIQKASVDDDGMVADEITMTFTKAYLNVEQLARDNLLTREALEALAPINTWAWFMFRTDDDLLESLSRHPYWANGRRLAQRALKLMGERIQPPDRSVYADMWIDSSEHDRQHFVDTRTNPTPS